jgi:hypothetical protein
MSNNTLTNIMHKLLGRGLYSYRAMTPAIMTSNRDYSGDAAKHGEVVNVPISTAKTATAVTPSGNRSDTLPGSSQKTVQIPLDQWFECEFALTDKDKKEIDKNEYFLPMDFHEAVKALAEKAETYVSGLYVGSYNVVGTATTTPFGSDTSASINCRKFLNQSAVPKDNRTLLVDNDAGANMLSLAAFSEADKSSDPGLIIDGEIGRKLGFRNIESNFIQSHTTGAVGTPLANGAQTAASATDSNGTTTLVVDGFTTKPSVGDVFSIAGNSQTYTVLSSSTLSGTESTLTIQPELAADVSDNAALTFIGDHVANLALHRDAITYAQRPLEGSDSSAADIEYTRDQVSGLSMRIEVQRAHKADIWSIDMLYGGKMTRPEGSVRLLG